MGIGDINTYNAFTFLTAVAAGARMADVAGDASLASACRASLARGRVALNTYLWNTSQGFWTQAWCESVDTQTRGGAALQGGGLYGQLWAYVLGLDKDVGVSESSIRSHLANERKRNLSPLGLVFATNRTVDYYHGCPKADAK